MNDTTAQETENPSLPHRGPDRRQGERRKVLVGRKKPCSGDAEIVVNRKDDVVQSIQVNCTCGEQILIDCLYNDAA